MLRSSLFLRTLPQQPQHKALTDNFGRFHNYLRISLTERCNLRCLYCMPETGLPTLTNKPDLLTTDEILRLTKLFVSLGVNKVRLTGGEPLLHPEVVNICQGIKDCGVNTIGMTTNAILLHRHIGKLKEAGLTNINVSLDTLQEDRFMFITRRKGFGRVMDTLKLAEHMNFNAVKVNCVVMRGINDLEVGSFATELTKDRNIEVRFIEYMPFDDNKWERKKMVPFMETMDRVEEACRERLLRLQQQQSKSDHHDVDGDGSDDDNKKQKQQQQQQQEKEEEKNIIELNKKLKLTLVPPKCGDTAKVFTFPGFRGRLGFITSMTTQFCGTCNRIRLTADGHLKVCLFDNNEVSLRDPLRRGASDEEMIDIIEGAIKRKHASLGGKESPEEIAKSSNRHMSSIGG